MSILRSTTSRSLITSYYVTGAIGGFKNKYDFRLSFYNTDTNGLIEKLQNMQSDKEIGNEELIEETQNLELKNNILCEVIMSELAIRELYQFIGRQQAIILSFINPSL
ncbi:MAG: hypothetical protein ACOC44_19485 [Promethearchaeia archaeon]